MLVAKFLWPKNVGEDSTQKLIKSVLGRIPFQCTTFPGASFQVAINSPKIHDLDLRDDCTSFQLSIPLEVGGRQHWKIITPFFVAAMKKGNLERVTQPKGIDHVS